MTSFKLKEVIVALCLLGLTACGEVSDELEGSSDSPVAEDPSGSPVTDEPVEPETTPPGDSPFAGSEFVFQVIDANEAFVTELTDGDVVDLSSLPEFFHIEAVSSDEFKSVSVQAYGPGFELDRVEESPVWTINPTSSGFTGGEGTFTLFAQGYSLDGAEGDSSEMSSISVTFSGGELPSAPPQGGSDPATTTEVSLQWDRPMLYTTGESLAENDIAGYEILYREAGELAYKRFYIDGAMSLETQLQVSGTGDFEFSIASVDTDGLYSVFTDPVVITI